MKSKFVTAQELADYLHVNRSTIYRAMKPCELLGFRVASEWRFDPEEVECWLKSRPQPEKEQLMVTAIGVDVNNSSTFLRRGWRRP